MKYIMTSITYIGLMIGAILFRAPHVCAQESACRQNVISLLQKIRQQYGQFKGVHTQMEYYYANASTPTAYLDSVTMNIVFNGDEYRMKTKGVEALLNSRYSITLFEEDHLMYLAKPSSVSSYNPVSVMDSLFAHIEGVSCNISYEGGLVKAAIQFPGQQAYRSMSFTIDTASGYLLKSSLVLKTIYMAPDADIASLKQQGYDEYAVVEIRFSEYRQEAIPADYFSESQFFHKKDKEYSVTDQYQDYKIFVATPNL